MKCKGCGQKYKWDGRGNLCPKCYNKAVPNEKLRVKPKQTGD